MRDPFVIIYALGGRDLTLENAQILVGQKIEGRKVSRVEKTNGKIIAWFA